MASVNGLRDPLPQPEPFPFGPPSIDELFDEGLRDFPDRIALIDGESTYSWTQLHNAVVDAAQGRPVGEIQTAPPSNSAELIIGALAIMHANGIWAANPPDGWVESNTHALRDTWGQTPEVTHRPAAVAFTSGTTGTPKAVVHSQHSLLLPAIVSADVEAPTPGERIGTPLDLGIANVFALGPLSALVRGSTFVVMKRRYANALAEDIAAFGVTRLFAVPTMAQDLAELAGEDAAAIDQLASLDRVVLGGAGADPQLVSTFAERFGLRPTVSYGLSEAPTGVVRESLDDPIGSRRGFPLPHIEVAIVDPDTADALPIGTLGEVCLRPASTGPWAGVWTGTLGYLGEPDRTETLFRGGRLHTGDMGRLDDDGAVSITGRIDNLIIRGGKNIDPAAIEDAARSIPGIVDAVAVAVSDERLGHVVGLALVSPHTLDYLELAEAALDVEEKLRVHIDAVTLVAEVPRNAMGKVDRLTLAAAFTPETRLNSDFFEPGTR